MSSASQQVAANSDANARTNSSAALVALGGGLLGLLWLTEILGDPTDGLLFYTLIIGAPLPIAIGLVLFASRKELAGNLALAGSILTLLGALWGVGPFIAIVGLALLIADVHGRGRSMRVGLGLLLGGIVGLTVRLEHGDGLVLFLPIVVIGAAVSAVSLRRIDATRT